VSNLPSLGTCRNWPGPGTNVNQEKKKRRALVLGIS
jgi:hypothetical protein